MYNAKIRPHPFQEISLLREFFKNLRGVYFGHVNTFCHLSTLGKRIASQMFERLPSQKKNL